MKNVEILINFRTFLMIIQIQIPHICGGFCLQYYRKDVPSVLTISHK